MLIRQERPTDLAAIDTVHRSAFAPPAPGVEPIEAGLVRALRVDPGWVPGLALVAEDPDAAQADGTAPVIGHVVCTIGAVGDTPALGLGPIGVLPAHQGSGVGGALMHAALSAADALGYPVVVLLGHLDYYPRFGFGPAVSLGITPPDSGWGDHFQARPLAGWDPALAGPFRYAAPFDDL